MNLKKMRLAAGLSQGQLAEKSGVSVRTIQKYEQGEIDIDFAKLATLAALSNACGCRVRQILSDQLRDQLRGTLF